jgi:hypothetical protein
MKWQASCYIYCIREKSGKEQKETAVRCVRKTRASMELPGRATPAARSSAFNSDFILYAVISRN